MNQIILIGHDAWLSSTVVGGANRIACHLFGSRNVEATDGITFILKNEDAARAFSAELRRMSDRIADAVKEGAFAPTPEVPA